MSATRSSGVLHPLATEHLPFFIIRPDETDMLVVVLAVILALAAVGFGTFYFRLLTLPHRMASISMKLRAEIVGILAV